MNVRAAVVRCFAVVLCGAAYSGKATEKILYNFSGPDGRGPAAGLVFDGMGNLYGSTEFGGSQDYGTAFELSPASGGSWTERVLHDFGVGKDAIEPAAPLALDGAGNLYSTAPNGGPHDAGIAYELSPVGSGWDYRIIRAFNGFDGYYPFSGVIVDPADNLYGTAGGGPGGASSGGVIYELTPRASHHWAEKVLHAFSVGRGAPNSPVGKLVLDPSGSTLYGTTEFGGAGFSTCGGSGCGTVFEFSLPNRRLRILHEFDKNGPVEGDQPITGLVFDRSGDLFGTTPSMVYEMIPAKDGHWKERVVHLFTVKHDGTDPSGEVVIDGAGNLFGVTAGGGDISACPQFHVGCGVVYELSPAPKGTWRYRVLHRFTNSPADGAFPDGALVFDGAGNLYGTTNGGGAAGMGTVYEIRP